MKHDSNPDLNAAERRSQIALMVREQGKVFVSDLVEKYGLTETSIRRDLTLLEKERRLERVHGGAVSLPGNFRTDTFAAKEKLQIKAKDGAATSSF
jgi:DeoR family fructose operon transcriptional repressor